MSDPTWHAEWLRLCESATPGPWRACHDDVYGVIMKGPQGMPDAAFVAASSPDRVRWLLERVRELSTWAQEVSAAGVDGHEEAWGAVKRYDEGPP